MTPFMVGYPKDEQDIVAAIQFAKDENKKIVARSGGHQYTGKSSGGEDTIVLDVEKFTDQCIKTVDGKNMLRLGLVCV